MATVSHLGTAAGFTTTAGSKTHTATPTANDLIVIVAAASGSNEANAATTAVSDDNADGLGAYTKITDSVDDTSGSSPRLTVWVRNALIGSATSTIFTATQASSTGGGPIIFRVTGMTLTGASAVRQSAIATGAAASTPAVTLGSAVLTANAVVGAVVNSTNPAGITPPSGWTENATEGDEGYSSPAVGLELCSRDSGETGTTITWGSTSASIWKASVLELDTSVPSVPPQSGWYGTMGGW